MTLARFAWRLVVRDGQGTLAAALGVAIATALAVSVVLFGIASGATMTRRALAELPVDAQAVLASGADAAAVSPVIAGDPAVSVAGPFDLIHFDAAALTRAGAATQTSVGVIVGIQPDYTATFGLFAIPQGSAQAGQVAISRDLATNLGATPGDTVTFQLPGGGHVDLLVSGIADIARADLLLGPTDAAHRSAGANSPTNVAVTDLATARAIEGQIPPNAVPASPPGTRGTPGVVGGSDPAVRREIHLRYDHAQLPGDPAAAQRWLDLARLRIDRLGNGQLTVVDDATASLAPVAADLAWGQVLFVFLALPGVALALILSRFAAEARSDATRRHAALLRARGASARELFLTFLAAAAARAAMGAAVGTALGVAFAIALFGGELASAASDAAPLVVSATLIAATILATLTAALPIRGQLRAELTAGRRELERPRPALWQRLYLDLIALAAAAAVYLLVGGAGLHPVITAEGNATVSLALTSFLAPLLLWVGGTLVLIRVMSFAIRRGAGLSGVLRRPLGPGGELAGRSLAARPAAAARVIVLLALAVSFAASILIFDATYRQQQLVDAELTLGADLRVASSAPIDAGAVATVAGRGVASATPFSDRVVYVGSEAQDLLAVDATTLPATAPLSDSFFQGMTADQAMASLASQPDAILVSAETATDYSIVPGDRLRIRIPDAHGILREVDFRMVGVALEFPTAPKDAFLVANLGYVASQSGDPRISFVLARTTGDGAAADLRGRLDKAWTVSDIGSTTARLANGVTSVDLRVLALMDVAFAVLIATVGVGLFLIAGLVERRRELATLLAIGAEPGQLRRSIAGETIIVAGAGLVAGLLVGGLVGITLLAVLAGIFDPPASMPALPFAAVGIAILLVMLGLAAATLAADRAVGRIDVLGALRER
jgi:putative ABC transport system permease protein